MPSKIDDYRLRIWLEDYLRNAKATAETLGEEAKKADQAEMNGIIIDVIDAAIAMRESINKATRLLWNLREADKVADLYEGEEK